MSKYLVDSSFIDNLISSAIKEKLNELCKVAKIYETLKRQRLDTRTIEKTMVIICTECYFLNDELFKYKGNK